MGHLRVEMGDLWVSGTWVECFGMVEAYRWVAWVE